MGYGDAVFVQLRLLGTVGEQEQHSIARPRLRHHQDMHRVGLQHVVPHVALVSRPLSVEKETTEIQARVLDPPSCEVMTVLGSQILHYQLWRQSLTDRDMTDLAKA